MNTYSLSLAGVALVALPSGALLAPGQATLIVSDLHLGKSDRIARRGGTLMPPYENAETLDRLAEDISATGPRTVVCLGDSFDDLAGAQSLDPTMRERLTLMQAGRDWIWIEGNHDPGPVDLGGTHRADWRLESVHLRHIATDRTPEISGHFHPKHRIRGAGPARACFVCDGNRLIMPAYGAYTGGMPATHSALPALFGHRAIAILTGKRAIPVPLDLGR